MSRGFVASINAESQWWRGALTLFTQGRNCVRWRLTLLTNGGNMWLTLIMSGGHTVKYINIKSSSVGRFRGKTYPITENVDGSFYMNVGRSGYRGVKDPDDHIIFTKADTGIIVVVITYEIGDTPPASATMRQYNTNLRNDQIEWLQMQPNAAETTRAAIDMIRAFMCPQGVK